MKNSRGMGAVMPSKMGKGVKKARKDNTDFTQYAEGGKVNEAGNYTKAKRVGKAQGKQFVPQPAKVKAKVKPFRKI